MPTSPGLRRVLHVSQSADAGVAHVVEELVRAQVTAGLHVTVASPRGELSDLVVAAGADAVQWQASREPSRGVLRETRLLRGIVTRADPDVVHLHSSKAGLVGRLLLRGRRPTVFSPHAWSWLAAEGRSRRAALGWERLAARWTEVVVCVSDDEAADGHRAGVTARTEVVANAVSPARVAQLLGGHDAAQARRLLRVGAATPLAVCVARLAPQKGQDVLLAAWRRVRATLPDAQLALVGSGPMRAQLEPLAAALPGVTLLGWQSRPTGLLWMRAASLVVCPSRYEGMSLVPLEAAALGVPVVASDVEGMRDGPPAPGRTLVPPDDAEALAEALVGLLASPSLLERGGRGAASWAAAQADDQGRRLLEVYRSLT